MGARFSALVQNGPGANPASCKMDIGSLSRGSSVEGKERVELHLYSPSGAFKACCRIKCTFHHFFFLRIFLKKVLLASYTFAIIPFGGSDILSSDFKNQNVCLEAENLLNLV
jgi:hypothetical protein